MRLRNCVARSTDLLEILADRIRTVSRPLDPDGEVPLASHATYSLGEIAAAYRLIDGRGALVLPQGGVRWIEDKQTELLFVTLEKSDKDYSPTTRYADYPVSPTLFHWESQNTASPETRAGRRYVEQRARGTKVVLFVRERKKDGRGETLPYHCLGHARFRSHESERPMKILWELERADARVALPGGKGGGPVETGMCGNRSCDGTYQYRPSVPGISGRIETPCRPAVREGIGKARCIARRKPAPAPRGVCRVRRVHTAGEGPRRAQVPAPAVRRYRMEASRDSSAPAWRFRGTSA